MSVTATLSERDVTPAPAEDRQANRTHSHLAVLDGWRALSICLVLIGHLAPLGPGRLGLNESVATTGMVLFFILSGFLITKTLLANPSIYTFAVRRIFRIVPLAWLAMLILLFANGPETDVWVSNFLFYANNADTLVMNGGGHLWSLSVEMQIYLLLAVFVAAFPSIGVKAIPLMCLAVTTLRVDNHIYISMVTWYRCDELLAGGVLALAYTGRYGLTAQRLLAWLHPLWLMPLVVISAHPAAGAIQYLRPYLAAAAVGATLYNPPEFFIRSSQHRSVIYLANVSYALYIIHGLLMATWLASGDTLVRYGKRPLFFATTFFLSHLSTFHFERYFMNLGKVLTSKNAGLFTGLKSSRAI
jgi:peptidoglycan/LPS O-acetylase OafA/YrhL